MIVGYYGRHSDDIERLDKLQRRKRIYVALSGITASALAASLYVFIKRAVRKGLVGTSPLIILIAAILATAVSSILMSLRISSEHSNITAISSAIGDDIQLHKCGSKILIGKGLKLRIVLDREIEQGRVMLYYRERKALCHHMTYLNWDYYNVKTKE